MSRTISRNRTLVLGFCTMAAVLCLLASYPWAQAQTGPTSRFCELKGTWVGSFDGGRFMLTAVPSRGASVQFMVHFVDGGDATLGGLFPGARASDAGQRGEAVWIGRGRMKSRAIAYGVRDVEGLPAPELAYIRIDEAILDFVDCETMHAVIAISIYRADQDADADGLPDPGQEPLFTVPGESMLRRWRGE